MARSSPLWPTGRRTIFFGDVASPPTLSKAVGDGRIRRLAPRVYTADRTSDPEAVVRANWAELCSYYLPGAVIVDRSAATPEVLCDGRLTVAAPTKRTSVRLPGLEIRIRHGEPLPSDLPWSYGLRMSSPARALVDNLEPSRSRDGRPSRTLSQAEVEDWVASKYVTWGAERTNRLLTDARHLAEATGRPEHAATINALSQQLKGELSPRPHAGQLLKAVTTGKAWDERRMRLFERAIATLRQPLPEAPGWLPEPATPGELPFYESYFSNYIEGTTFTVAEAREIIASGSPPSERPADGHDILGTHDCVVDPIGRAATSTDVAALTKHLVARHGTIMRGRPDTHPGTWKSVSNRAGAYEFVAPELVEGTLTRALERVGEIPEGLPRALYVMLVVAEVHPFTDGNGRVARVMMNAELSAVGAARIVIPNVYRDEYLSALRNVSVTDGDLTAFIRAMTYAWRWSAAMPWHDAEATAGQLIATSAFQHPAAEGARLELP